MSSIFIKLHIFILNSCILTILFGRFNEIVHIMIPHTNTAEGCSLIRTLWRSATQRCLSAFWWASSADIRVLFPWIVISQQGIFKVILPGNHDVPLSADYKTKQNMEVISIERSTYEELLTSFNSFVTKMKEMTSRGNDKGMDEWLDNQDVCQMLNISPGVTGTGPWHHPQHVKRSLT